MADYPQKCNGHNCRIYTQCTSWHPKASQNLCQQCAKKKDMTIVEETIEEMVTQYKKRRRAIPPDEFRQMLKNLVETVEQYH